MIKLIKKPEPQVLSTNKSNWTTLLLGHISRGEKVPSVLSNAYNTTEVKDSLRLESHSKCMYCESKVGHITYEHIEHIKPKAKTKFPQLAYEYDNLGLSCPKCNMNKSDTYDINNTFINPYIDNPITHFVSYGAFIWAKSGDNRAKLSELEIDLNRAELLEIRGERMKTIRGLVDTYNNTPNGILKNALKKEIDLEIAENKPYSFSAKKLVLDLMI
ncbi:MAG: HNH endonuclease [Lutibacter sp.]|uniref:HNH endonuclease n=1 Tax=Lutibacter sp. TaxID=1925666 RepID=UPI0019FC4A52|nr:HNH endonuclease [Lutibacter sp.]NOR28055.1 HNH endonuclease [Lutibacter sp.]